MSALDAGRELDAIVAEKVMGWPRIEEYEAFERHVARGGVILSSGPEIFRVGIIPEPWRPSTEIAAAWTVVEALKAKGWAVSLASNPHAPQNGAKFYRGALMLGWSIFDAEKHDGFWSVRATLPHAICTAALLTLASPDASPSPLAQTSRGDA